MIINAKLAEAAKEPTAESQLTPAELAMATQFGITADQYLQNKVIYK